MAEFKINRIRFTWKGDWVTGTSYIKDEIVRYGGKSYVCLVGHVASADFNTDLDFINTATEPDTAAPKWELWFDGYNWKNNWLPNTFYALGDYVRYNSLIYICNDSHTSAATSVLGLEADQSKWTRYAVTDDWLSSWAPVVRYRLNDVVRYGGTIYRCILNHTSAATTALGLEADQSKWEVLTYANDWKTDWTVSTRYKLGDVIRYGGIIYKCTTGHTSAATVAIGIDPDISKWTIVHNGIDYKFAWASSTRYKLNDIVKYGADLYICTTSHTSTTTFDTNKFAVWLPGLEFADEWSSAVSYIKGDIVTYGGYQYVSNTTNNLSNIPSIDAVNWTLLVKNYNISGDWDDQTLYKTGDLVRRDGYLYVAINDSSSVETTNTDFWELVNPGMHWKGTWVPQTVYVVGDVVTYFSTSYICLQKHTALITPLADVNNVNWVIYIRGDTRETLQVQGDMQSYNNNSWDSVKIGTTGNLLKSTGALLPIPAWSDWGVIGKVYYVASTGVDTPSYGTTISTPWKSIKYACSQIYGPATIFVKTGTYSETLPISVPAGVAIVGDELRGSVVRPARTINILATGSSSSTNAITANTTIGMQDSDPIQVTVQERSGFVYATTTGTNKITLSNTIGFYVGMPIKFIGSTFGNLSSNVIYYVLSYDTISSTITVSTTLNGPVVAVTSASGSFAYVANQFAGLTSGQVYYVIGSSITPTSFKIATAPGSQNPVQLADTSNQSAPMFGADAIKDMFYVRNGCGIRNMTLTGLLGGLSSANVYGTSRPTGGAYVSLDPGTGPNDTSVQITTKSPYVQNVTTFGQGCTGLKIDGTLHNGGNRSIVANDFTQILSDGIGCWCTGTNALTELVSVFSYYGHVGYLAENGGKIRATNGNTSYGNYGCVAEGYDTAETPISGAVNNRSQQAQIAQAFIGEATNKILKLEFSNAGQAYTAATYAFTGSGSGAIAIQDEFRDGGIYETRITGTDYSAGGVGYITAGNQAQAGTTQTVTIASNDQRTFNNYNGMRIIITSGTGVGQYGYVAYYDAVTKVVTVGRESISAQTCTATTTSTLTVADTTQFAPGQAVVIAPNKQTTTAYNTIHTVATFTGYISGTTLYVTAAGAGVLAKGMFITGAGILGTPYIVSNIQGTGAGSTWVVSSTQAVGSSGSPIALTGTNNLITCSSTAGMYVGEQVVFTGSTFGNIVASTTYYIINIIDNTLVISSTYQGSVFPVSNATGLCNVTAGGMLGGVSEGQIYYIIASGFTATTISISATPGGSAITMTPQTYGTVMYVNVVGWENINPGTPPVSLLDSTSVYSIEPAVRFSSPSYYAATSTLPGAGNWTANAYGGGRFVALTSSTATVTSTDGITWSNGGSLPLASSWTSVAYGNNIFLAVSSTSGLVAISSNGSTWTSSNSGSSGFNHIAYGSNRFIAITSGTGTAYWSADGNSWTSMNLGASAAWKSAAYGSIGTWVAIAGTNSNVAAYSTDNGNSWTATTLPSSANWISVAWGNGRFVAIAQGGTASAYSFDGITWISSSLPIGANWVDISYGAGLFVTVASGTSSIATSQDGLVWKTRTLSGSGTWTSITFGNPTAAPTWVISATGSTSTVAYVKTGATALGRAVVANNKISQIKIWEPGSGYSTPLPAAQITDPNATTLATSLCRVGNGVLGNPTFVARGVNYRTSTTVVTIQSGDGYADIYQPSKYLVVSGLASLPTPGAALTISGLASQYRIVVINDLGSGNVQFQVSPPLSIDVAPAHGTAISIRQKYSQCRITGHDFLLVGTGNQATSNFPNVDVNTALIYRQISENNGGRVFQTSTDQDGNFKVGNLFGVEQASGIVTISADQLSLTGLQTLSLGGFSLGTNSVVINQFSTDSYFIANSDNIVPTQKAIKSYIARNIAGGGSNAQAGALVAGTFGVGGPNKIYSSTQTQLYVRNSMNFKTSGGKGGINGTMLAKSLFAHGFGDKSGG